MATRHDEERGDDRPVYIISVAAELAGVHPQTLRIYERKGLVRPERTAGNTRRYSDRDIDVLRMIQDLTQDSGVNLAGVKMIIEMREEVQALRRRAQELERELRASRRFQRLERDRIKARSAEIVPLKSVFRPPWQKRARSS